MREVKGLLSAKDKRFAIIVARFNETITSKLLDGAIESLIRHGVNTSDIVTIWVPGAFELASTAKKIEQLGTYDAIVCLGAVIKGQTDHYDFVAGNAASGIASVGQNGVLPVLFGVLTVDTVEQAFNRSGIKEGNAGYDAALSAIEMVSVYEQINNL